MDAGSRERHELSSAFEDGSFWDNAAPYGPNGYARGEGREISGRLVFGFVTDLSAQVLARGVMEGTDGAVYLWTVRRPGHEDLNGRTRLATRTHQTVREAAGGLLELERGFINPDAYAGYREQIARI